MALNNAFFSALLKAWIVFTQIKYFFKSDEYSDLSDNEIAKLAQQDPDLFAVIYERFFDKLYKFFHFRTRNQQLSEDLTGDTFEKIIKNLHKFEDKGIPVEVWFYTIARNVMNDHFRKAKDVDDIDELVGAAEPREEFDCTKLDKKMMTEQLWEIIQTLPNNYQTLWSLKLTEDLSHKSIAEVMGVSEQNVNVMIYRSMQRFKKNLLARNEEN